MSFLRMPNPRSRIHNTVSRNTEAKQKRIELKFNGAMSTKATLTAVKFMPQMKLMAPSIKSTLENLDFA